MNRPHIPNYSESVHKRSRRKRLEHAGYKFEPPPNNDHPNPLWCVMRPTGQILQHYKRLGNALNGAEIDIRKVVRKHVENPKTNQHQKDYWGKVLERYDSYKPDFKDIW